MERICEPELMDEEGQARAYAEADFSASDGALVQLVLRRMQGLGRLRSLVDLGCGPGNLSFPLSDARPDLSILAIDGAAAMLAPALRRQHAEPRRWPGLRFLQACLPLQAGSLDSLPQAFRPPFQALVSNSLLHHLHDPLVLWRSIRELGAPGSLVVVRDLRRPADQSQLERLVARHASGAAPLLQRDYRASLHAAFRPEEVAAQLDAMGLACLAVQPLADRYLDVIGFLP